MKNVKQYLQRFKEMPLSKKFQYIFAGTITVALMTAIPVYAWFTNQKKAAEMYKVKYPNSLYINAAYREDQKYFELDGININDYAKNPLTGAKLYDADNNPIFVSKYSYVFSVSGASTKEFILQMAHTNNNLFSYKIYEATQWNSENEAKTAAENDTDRIIKYSTHQNSHTENTIQVVGDVYVDSPPDNPPPVNLYYVKGNALDGEYKNPKQADVEDNGAADGNAAPDGENDDLDAENENEEETVKFAEKNVNDSFYFKTYGNYANVHERSVPLYWQGNVTVTTDDNKKFCKYFILEVTWDNEEQKEQVKKETDMVYFSVKRVS